jgi:anti-sigma factor ChrR (cupin superfamily)
MNRRHPGSPFPSAMTETELAQAEAHLAECSECASEVRGLANVFLEPDEAHGLPAPSPALRDRLLASIAEKPRLAAYADAAAKLLDVSREHALELLRRIDEPNRWLPTPFEGVEGYWFQGGPATEGSFAGFVRVHAGTQLPLHDHIGPEQGLVLQGRFADENGRVYHPGDRVDMAKGSRHALNALPIIDCVFVVVAHGGVRFGDVEFLPETMV